MRRYAITDVALGLVFVGLAALVGWGAFVSSFSDAGICPAGLPCDFSALLHASVGTPIGIGAAVLFLGIGARMLWNVWRGQG
jgi:hypothetical protein